MDIVCKPFPNSFVEIFILIISKVHEDSNSKLAIFSFAEQIILKMLEKMSESGVFSSVGSDCYCTFIKLLILLSDNIVFYVQ